MWNFACLLTNGLMGMLLLFTARLICNCLNIAKPGFAFIQMDSFFQDQIILYHKIYKNKEEKRDQLERMNALRGQGFQMITLRVVSLQRTQEFNSTMRHLHFYLFTLISTSLSLQRTQSLIDKKSQPQKEINQLQNILNH